MKTCGQQFQALERNFWYSFFFKETTDGLAHLRYLYPRYIWGFKGDCPPPQGFATLTKKNVTTRYYLRPTLICFKRHFKRQYTLILRGENTKNAIF